MSTDVPFQTVITKKRKNRRQKVQNINCTRPVKEEFDVTRAIHVIDGHLSELKQSTFYHELIERLSTTVPKEIVCFGLGSLHSYISRHQLALGILLQETFNVSSKYTDPCFSASDISVLAHFNVNVIEENLEGKYQSNYITTLFYLPHCPKQLVNNLLWKNFNYASIKNIILVTNSFQRIVERTPSRFLSSIEYLEKLQPFAQETELLEFGSGDIFNDLAVITFANLPSAEDNFWLSTTEPVYSEDIELIQKND